MCSEGVTTPANDPSVFRELVEHAWAIPVVYMSGFPTRDIEVTALSGTRMPILSKSLRREEPAARLHEALVGAAFAANGQWYGPWSRSGCGASE